MWPSSDISTTSESSGEDLRAKEVEISHLKGELHELKRTLKTASTKSMNQAESATEKTKALETALEQYVNSCTDLESQVSKLEQQKEAMIGDLAAREEEVNASRSALKEKFNLECSISDLKQQLEDA